MSGYAFNLPPEFIELVAERAAELVTARHAPQTAQRWLTMEEAAEYLRCKPQRIYDLRSSGRLSRTGDGSRVLVDRVELDEYLSGGR
jgi:excisionase family DNA binding protein